LNIDSTRQCQLGRRIAPPVIATFELARVIYGKEKSGFDMLVEAALVLGGTRILRVSSQARRPCH